MSHEPYFTIRTSAIQGRGAFAVRRIRKGTRIIEYTGEPITQEEADERYDDDAMERHHTFLFSIDDDLVVDGAVGGNESRYINHSCRPNCEAVIEDGRIWVEALETIQPGAELVYDYAYERTGTPSPSWDRLYACRCGAPGCRGTILKPAPKPRKRAKTAAKTRKSASRPKASKPKATKTRKTGGRGR